MIVVQNQFLLMIFFLNNSAIANIPVNKKNDNIIKLNSNIKSQTLSFTNYKNSYDANVININYAIQSNSYNAKIELTTKGCEEPYSIQVRAKNHFQYMPSLIHKFYLIDKNAITIPENGSTICENTPTFDWKNAFCSDNPVIEIATDSSFSKDSIVYSSQTQGTSTTITDPLDSNKTYYWRLITKDNDTITSSSQTFSFVVGIPDAPTLISPVSGKKSINKYPTFVWSEITGATNYTIEVATDKDFKNIITGYPVTDITTTSYKSTVEMPDGNIYWRVKAKTVCESAYSEPLSVEIIQATAITSDCMTNSSICSNTYSFTWSDIEGVNYEYQFSSDWEFNGANTYKTDSNQFVSPILTSNTPYYFRVRSTEDDYQSSWSNCSVIYKEAPSSPSLNPISKTCDGSNINVSWTAPATGTVTKYEYTINGNNPTDTTNTSITLPNSALENGYTFEVKAYNDICSGTSDSVTVSSGAIPSAPGALTITTTCNGTGSQFSYGASTGTLTHYTYQIGTASEQNNSTNLSVNPINLSGKDGQTITIKSYNGTCLGGSVSGTINLLTIPSNPSNLLINTTCSGVGSSVSWDAPTETVTKYTYEFNSEGETDNSPLTSTSISSVDLSSHDGKTLTIKAYNGICELGSVATTVDILSIPSNPSNLQINESCDGTASSVSWDAPSETVTKYTYEFDSEGETDNSPLTSTSISSIDLSSHDGKTLTIKAYNGSCELGSISDTVSIPGYPSNPILSTPDGCTGSPSTATINFNVGEGGTQITSVKLNTTAGSVAGDSATVDISGWSSGNYTWEVVRTVSGCSSTFTQAMTINDCASPGSAIGWLGKESGDPSYGSDGWKTTNSPTCLGCTPGPAYKAFNGPKDGTLYNGYLYWADYGHNRIVKWRESDGVSQGWLGKCTTDTAGSNGWKTDECNTNSPNNDYQSFKSPYDVEVCNEGGFDYLYVADYSNQRISKWKDDGGVAIGWFGYGNSGWQTSDVTCVVSGNYGSFNQPSGIAIDSTNGYIYVSEIGNYCVSRWTLAGGVPSGWIGDNLDSTDLGGNGWQTVAGRSSGGSYKSFSSAQDVAYYNNYLYIPDRNADRICKWKADDGTAIGCIGGGNTGWIQTSSYFTAGDGLSYFDRPCGVHVQDGYIYVADYGNHRISKWRDSDGTAIEWIGSGGDGWKTIPGASSYGKNFKQFYNPDGIFVNSTHIYVGENNAFRISKWAK